MGFFDLFKGSSGRTLSNAMAQQQQHASWVNRNAQIYGQNMSDRISRYGEGDLGFSSDPRIAAGQLTGLERGKLVYGQTLGQTGADVQDIIKRRKDRLNLEDPASSRMRDSRNRQIRMAQASGATPSQLAQIRRSAESDIGDYEFNAGGQALSDYQSLVGNILQGQTGLELGYGGLEKAGEQVQVPRSRGLLGSVICTHLYNSGYMDENTFKKDQEYGAHMILNNPSVYMGYRVLADPIVTLMERSRFFTWVVSIPARHWARDMAGEEDIIGRLISKIGEPVCWAIGRLRYGSLRKA